MKTKLTIFLFLTLTLSSIAVLLLACSKNKEPEVTGCNAFEHNGENYSNVGCAPGILSFDYRRNDSPSFHIECSNGCISSVSLN